MRVGDFCGNDFVIGTGPEMSVRAAARRMAEEGVGSLIVIDRSGVLAGVITDRDITVRVVARGLDPSRTTVSEAMSSPPVTISNTAEVSEAIQLMRGASVRRLPVLDRHGKAVGVVSFDDLFIHSSRALANLADMIDSERRPIRQNNE